MNQLMTKLMKPTALAIAFSFLSACAVRQPDLVLVNQDGDHRKSCGTLESEMENVRNELHSSLHKRSGSDQPYSTGSGVETPKYEAYRERYNHLASIAKDKKCHFPTKECPATKKRK